MLISEWIKLLFFLLVPGACLESGSKQGVHQSWYGRQNVAWDEISGSQYKRRMAKMCGKNLIHEPSSYLWTISTRPPSYLFGTLHVAYKHVWPLVDPIVKQTFRTADSVYFELDLTDPHTLHNLAVCQLLPQSQNLTSLLPSKLISRIEAFIVSILQEIHDWKRSDLRDRAIHVFTTITTDWRRKRPMWILILLHSLTYGDFLDATLPVLDLFMAHEARNAGKFCGAVEDVSDQCDPLNNVDNMQAAFALELTLDRLTTQRTNLQKLSEKNDLRATPVHQANERETHRLKSFMNAIEQIANPVNTQSEQTTDPIEQMITSYNCGTLKSLLQRNPARLFFLGQGVQVFPSTSRVFVRNDLFWHHSLQVAQPFGQQMMKQLLDLEHHLNTELILKRNRKMAASINSKLKLAESLNKSAFFAIGAAHFLGQSSSIIYHLKRFGYEIRPVPRNSYLNRGSRLNTNGLNRISRNQKDHIMFPPEDDLPKFQPKFVRFEKSTIKIEDFGNQGLRKSPLNFRPSVTTPAKIPNYAAFSTNTLKKHQSHNPSSQRSRSANLATSVGIDFYFSIFITLLINSY